MYSPLGQAGQVVAAGTLGLEGGDAEPAGGAVVAGARVGGDGVLDDLAAAGGGLELGGGGQVADDGHLGQRPRGRGGERAARGEGGTAGEEGRHFGGGLWRVFVWSVVCGIVGLREREAKEEFEIDVAVLVWGMYVYDRKEGGSRRRQGWRFGVDRQLAWVFGDVQRQRAERVSHRPSRPVAVRLT